MIIRLSLLRTWTVMLLLGACGCNSPFSNKDGLYTDKDIQRQIVRRLGQQTEKLPGEQELHSMAGQQFQSEEFISTVERRQLARNDRLREAQQMVRNEVLDLNQCLVLAFEFSDKIETSRQQARTVVGSQMIAESRFLPQLQYVGAEAGQDQNGGGSTSSSNHRLVLNSTLLEFGADNPIDVAIREEQRAAVFGYDETVRLVLSSVRRVFFTILLRHQQLEQRQELLKGFGERLNLVRQREQQRLVPQIDVLTAQLNVLSEQARINVLKREIARLKFELIRLLGLPLGISNIEVKGEMKSWSIELDMAVKIGLLRSREVAAARARFYEQSRRVQQLWAANAPDINVRAALQNDDTAVGLNLRKEGATYELSGFSQALLSRNGDQTILPRVGADPLRDSETEWLVAMSISIPVFEGKLREGRRIRERAGLMAAASTLRDVTSTVEFNVRKSYQDLLEAKEVLTSEKEQVGISKQRLDIQEKLRDQGAVTDDQLETFRVRYFDDQDSMFRQEISVVEAQERLRAIMWYFEPDTN